MRRFVWLVPVVVLFVVGGIGLFRSQPPAYLGKPAPSFSLPILGDEERKLGIEELRGKPVVLNFWASWCEPCKEEAPELARAARASSGRVVFLGVNILDQDKVAERFAASNLPYESVIDRNAVVSKRYGVTGAPETVFIDRDGVVVGKYIGKLTDGRLGSLVDDLLALRPGGTLRISGRGETRPVP